MLRDHRSGYLLQLFHDAKAYLLAAWFYVDLLGSVFQIESYKKLVGHNINLIGCDQNFLKLNKIEIILQHIFSYFKNSFFLIASSITTSDR